jgi:hypothetical protein
MNPSRECSIDGCQRKHQARGLCDMHYQRSRAEKRYRDDPPLEVAPGEQWLGVVGFDDLYEVSNFGRVRSVRRPGSAGGLIAPAAHPSGHLYIGLHRGKRTSVQVHRLVLEAFVGACPQGMEALHANGDPADNRLENLRWGTRSENQRDRIRHGCSWQVNKTHCPRGHELVAPNLVPSSSGRNCLACKRATSKANYHGVPTSQEVADAYYAQITKGSPMTNPAPHLSAHEQAEVDRFGIHNDDEQAHE